MSSYNTSFRTGSNSYGQFWFGGNTFPGFLYKKNVGVGGRRSTKFNAGGNTTCNQPGEFWNKYKPGQGGVGASSTATRRAKIRQATVCDIQGPCGNYYKYLGLFDNYTGRGLNAYYPYLTPSELEQLKLLFQSGNSLQQVIKDFVDVAEGPIFQPVSTLNSVFSTNSDPLPNSPNYVTNTSPIKVNNWSVTNGNVAVSAYNSSVWLFDSVTNSTLPCPNNANFIAFQLNGSISQNIGGPLYQGSKYLFSIYAANRGTGATNKYNGIVSQLYIYITINGKQIGANYNPGNGTTTPPSQIPWLQYTFTFTWPYPTTYNPVLTIGQINTIPANDYSIFISQPNLTLV